MRNRSVSGLLGTLVCAALSCASPLPPQDKAPPPASVAHAPMPANAPSSSGGPTAENFPLACQPGHLMTDVETTVPAIVISTGKIAVTPTMKVQLEAYAAQVELVTWPEQVLVETIPSVIVTESSSAAQNHSFRLELKPKNPLADSWHILRFAVAPAGTRPMSSCRAVGDGKLGALFHPKSSPIVRAIQVCKKAGGASKISVLFSERVVANFDPGAAIVVSLATGTAKCTGLPLDTVAMKDGSAGTVNEASVACTGLPNAEIVTVNLIGTFALTTGAVVGLAPGVSQPKATGILGNIPPIAEGCVELPLIAAEGGAQ